MVKTMIDTFWPAHDKRYDAAGATTTGLGASAEIRKNNGDYCGKYCN